MHGLLITKVKLQCSLSLCGLLFYRGISRWLTDNQTMQYPNTEGLDSFFSGKVALLVSSASLLLFLPCSHRHLGRVFSQPHHLGRYLLAWVTMRMGRVTVASRRIV